MGNKREPTKERAALTIFMSHKHKDKDMAFVIKRELENYGADRLKFFLSEGIPFGEEWHEGIVKALRETDWFFLLYTDPSAEWDWCLYESGYFAAKADKRRLICLLGQGLQPPGPLTKWQAVKAEQEDWVKLIRQIFGDPPRPKVQPINQKLANDPKTIRTLARKILQEFMRKSLTDYYNRFLVLTLESNLIKKLDSTHKIPPEALVESNSESLRMFGLLHSADKKWTWGDLLNEQDPNEIGPWVESLGVLLWKAANNLDFNACLPLFVCSRLEKSFHPVIYTRDRVSDAMRFKIVFIEKLPEEDPRPVGDLGAVSVLLTMARKFGSGVIDKFRDELSRLQGLTASPEKVGGCLERLQLAIQRIEAEGRDLGFNRDILLAAFKPEERSRVKQLIEEEWGPLRKKLPEEVKAKNVGEILKVLEKLHSMNKEFMILAANRYIELLREVG